MGKVRCRLAPAPTGKLHLGTAHTGLFNYLFAKHFNGDFILRIDDTDKKRSKKKYELDILESLKWLGTRWSEGPDIGGPYAPYYESKRANTYNEFVDRLLKAGKAYYCFCTPEELAKEQKKRQQAKLPPKYSGKCANNSPAKQKKLLSEKKNAAVRFRTPNKKVTYKDIVRSPITIDASLIGDFVILRSDGSALLVLATTVDDIQMKITHTIRGEDFINLIPKQILLFEALGYKPPVFGTLSFIYAPDKTKLSKRHGATSVSEYRKLGYLPEALVNYLCSLGWSMPDERAIFSLDEAIKYFDGTRIQKSAPIFDIKKLNWFNSFYIRQTTDSKLARLINDLYAQKFDRTLLTKTVPLIKERIKRLDEYETLANFFYKAPKNYEKDLSAYKSWFLKLTQIYQETIWLYEKLYRLTKKTAKKDKKIMRDLFMALRVALTGKSVGPPLFESMEILGRKEVIKRLKKAASQIIAL